MAEKQFSLEAAIEHLQRVEKVGGSRPWRLTIRKHNPGGMSGHGTTEVESIQAGFDWTAGQVIVYPAKPLTELTPEQVEAIEQSVRKGSSWHAYEAQRKLSERASAAETRVAELEKRLAESHTHSGRPTEPGLYAWVPEQGSPAIVQVHRRPTAHSPGNTLNASAVPGSTFYDGCALESWPATGWVSLRPSAGANGSRNAGVQACLSSDGMPNHCVLWKCHEAKTCARDVTAASPLPDCHCEACDPIKIETDKDGHLISSNMRMIVCAICGNKRCPHAADHRNACTNSNEPGQPGSSYPRIFPDAVGGNDAGK